jgi:Na+/proline symporter
MVKHRLGSLRAEQLTNSIIVIIGILWSLVQIVGGAKIISHFGSIGYEWALLLTGVVVACYLILG